MTLLTSMLERPLDPSYQAAADRRRAAGEAPATSSRTVLVFVMMLLTGLLFAIGSFRSYWSPTPWWRAGLETFAIGMAAAGVAYLVGALLKGLV